MAVTAPRLFHAFALAMLFLLQCAAAGAAPTVNLQAASGGMWRDVEPRNVVAAGARMTVPQRYRLVALDAAVFNETMALAPLEFSDAAQRIALVVTLPLPDGGTGRFQVLETQLMAPALAARFPEIRTWTGQGIDDPSATARLDWTPQGFHAMVLSSTKGRVFIDPYSGGDTTHYISYYTRDQAPPDRTGIVRLPPIDRDGRMAAQLQRLKAQTGALSSGMQLRTYRLAVAATGEYTAFFGGTVPLGMAAIVTAVNRVVGVYEVEVAVRMQLVANNDLIVYTDGATDPYTNSDGRTMLDQNQTNLDAVIGLANYDIGHVFSTGGGGVAQLRVPCTAAKARGVTGSTAPTGDAFWVDYVAHEMGHQFGSDHTFNSVTDSCGGFPPNRNAATAFEPGSGSTIMGYAGLCGADNLQPHTDPYFHSSSFDEIVAYTTVGAGNACAVTTATGNNLPVVAMPASGFTIPANTPFALTGAATDVDGDALTYNWEEFDLGTEGAPGRPTVAPFFRSWNATTSPTRTFPRLSDLLANTLAKGEVLPNITRPLNFRMTVRDNRAGGGGVAYGTLSFNVTTAAGPFVVTAPDTNVVFPRASTQTVTWNVANTAAAPVSCASVDILLSTDGGNTFPTTLQAATPNTGSRLVTLPDVNTTTARIKVACSSNVFFAMSKADFTIGINPGPVVVTDPATNVSLTGATLNGTVGSNGATTTVTFNYGTTRGYGATVAATQSPVASGATNLPVSAAIVGLGCGTLYHFQAVGANALGTTKGNDLTFTTAACPVTTTTLSSNNYPASVGAVVTFTATVVGTTTTPTGTVAFMAGGIDIGDCAAVPTTGNGTTGTAVCRTNQLVQGTHTITATYSGNAENGSSTSRALTQQVLPGGIGVASIVKNPFGPIEVRGANLVGNTIFDFGPVVEIQLGETPGDGTMFTEIDFQGLTSDFSTVFSVRSGAPLQRLMLRNVAGDLSIINGRLIAKRSPDGDAAPFLHLASHGGLIISDTGSVDAPSGLTLDTLGGTWTTGRNIVVLGNAEGGSHLQLYGANIMGYGRLEGNAITMATFGNARNAVNNAGYFLQNGLQIHPDTGGSVALTLAANGPAPQVLNLFVHGDAAVWMPSAWPSGVNLPPNNAVVAPGGFRPPGVPLPAYGGGSLILQATGKLSLVDGGTNDFVFPGSVVFKADRAIDLRGVRVNQGWTTAGKPFQGLYLEAPSIGSSLGNIMVYSNDLNWVNFSTFPTAPVRAFSLVRKPNGTASFAAADATAPHLNTYSILNAAAANGQCWTCLVNTQPVNMFGP